MIVKFCVHSLSALIDNDFFDQRMRASLELLSESAQEEVFEDMESYFDEDPSMEDVKEYLSGELNRRLPFGF